MKKNGMITVAILIVSYNGKKYLDDCLSSVTSGHYSSIQQLVYVLDNASTDGTVEYLRSQWPHIRVIPQVDNLGFAAGNNVGWQLITSEHPTVDYLFLLNQDTIVEGNFLQPLVSFMEDHHQAVAVQPKLLLHPQTDKINSLGNRIHVLGFGYASHNNEIDSGADAIREINYASGAAVLLRASWLHRSGLFEDFMFMYLEDLELGWRALLEGYKNYLVPTSVVFHKFEFQRGLKQWYYFERNRWWIVLRNYRLATLLLLLPLVLFMELGQIFFAYTNGRLRAKLDSYRYFFSGRHLQYLWRSRVKIQRARRLSDRQLLRQFTAVIQYQPLANPLLLYVANPLCWLYASVLRLLVFW